MGNYGITHGRMYGDGITDQSWNLSPPSSTNQETFWNMPEQLMYQQPAQGPLFPLRPIVFISLSVSNSNQPIVAEVKPTMPQLIDSNKIVEAIRKHFGV